MMLPEPCLRIWGAAYFMPSITLRTNVTIAASKRSDLEALDAAGLRRAAGIVEQAIDAAEFLDRQLDQRAHLLFDRDIGLAEDAVGAEFFGQRLALRHAAPGDDDLRAFGDEDLRGAQSDAACCPCDHRNLAVQPSHVVILALLFRMPQLMIAACTMVLNWLRSMMRSPSLTCTI